MKLITSPAYERYRRLHPEIRRELRRAADSAGVLYLELLRPNQHAHVVRARVEVMRFLRDRGYSFPAIGDALGLHHATVIHNLKRHAKIEPSREPAPFPDYSGEWAI